MAAHAADLIAVLDHLGVEQSVMAGHSMGAYVVARLAVDHPERCAAAVLVDGGLTLPGSEGADPDTFLDAFLGPAVARLSMTFADRDAYRGFWHAHPAFAAADAGVSDDDLDAYANHDLVGSPPELRSSVNAAAVRGDGREIHAIGDAAHRLAVPASLLRADRGLLNEPNPMVPADYAKQWLEEDPQRRTVAEVSATNHYSILMGKGAPTVADTIVRYAA
jgi:pimeloyl-ACP methyl ester carboxylesterase